uniref:Uncharacterized protein n=1 Tax=Rhizophora mucronata TaxID=61149 RepID=A0A2P2PFI5_RHIMU
MQNYFLRARHTHILIDHNTPSPQGVEKRIQINVRDHKDHNKTPT